MRHVKRVTDITNTCDTYIIYIGNYTCHRYLQFRSVFLHVAGIAAKDSQKKCMNETKQTLENTTNTENTFSALTDNSGTTRQISLIFEIEFTIFSLIALDVMREHWNFYDKYYSPP